MRKLYEMLQLSKQKKAFRSKRNLAQPRTTRLTHARRMHDNLQYIYLETTHGLLGGLSIVMHRT